MSENERLDKIDYPEVSEEERARMISAGAWFRAKERAFGPGDPVEDWLQAEAEVDSSVQLVTTERRWAEAEADRHLRWSVGDRFSGNTPTDTAAILSAIDAIEQQMADSGNYDPLVVAKVARTFRKDVASWANEHREQSEEKTLLLGKWQERGRVLLHNARLSVDDLRQWFSDKWEHYRVYHSGEVVPPGGYDCTNCHTRNEMANTGHLGPCSNCYQTRFHRF